MNINHFTSPSVRHAFARVQWSALSAAVIMVGLPFTRAQNVLPPITDPNDTSQFDVVRSGEQPLTTTARGINPYRIGQATITPRLDYVYTSADGLNGRQGDQRSTTVQSISPGFQVTLGNNWALDYAPTWSFYSDSSFEDTLAHDGDLSASFQIEDWQLGFNQTYSYDISTQVETGVQTPQDQWSTSVSGAYQLNRPTTVNLGLSQSQTYTSEFTDTETRSLSAGLRHQRSQTTYYSLDFGVGKTKINPGFDLDFYQITLGGDWQPTQKLGLGLRVGANNSQFDIPGAPNIENPIYTADLRYQALPETSISLVAERDANASLFQNQVSEGEIYSVSLRQRLLGRFYFTGSVGRSFGGYVDPTGEALGSRDDEQDTISGSLSTRLNDKISISGSYRRFENVSNDSDFSFESNQYSLQVSYRY